MALHEKWADYTEKEIYKTIKEKCLHCPYSSTEKQSEDFISNCTCSYILITGKMRGCRPEDCMHHLDKDVQKPNLQEFSLRLYVE